MDLINKDTKFKKYYKFSDSKYIILNRIIKISQNNENLNILNIVELNVKYTFRYIKIKIYPYIK